jgi:ribosomal protein S18 acetylase RimI-like enzyme
MMSTSAPEPVRRAGPADAAPIAVVQVRSWQGAYRGLLPQEYLDGLDPADAADRWRRGLERNDWPTRGTIVAVSDGQVRGFAHFGPTRDADTDAGGSRAGEINAIYVLPEAWGSGLGRSLMTGALSELAAGGYETATLWVLESNARARRFYARAGWTADGSAKRADIGGSPVTEVRYRRPLP